MMDKQKPCVKCNNTGRIKKEDGSISICFDCLTNGNMDQDERVMKDSKIRV